MKFIRRLREALSKIQYLVDGNGCWNWPKALSKDGYGQLRFRINKKTISWRAHRATWTVSKGKIPDGKLVCHRCDNRACANPDHLFLGTPRDNFNDMMAKGRGRNIKKPRLAYCKRGHRFDEANTYWFKNGYGYMSRKCRECGKASARRQRENAK